MNSKKELQFNASTLILPLISVLILWIVFWYEVRFNVDFNFLGVQPRTLSGLVGIICSPFIHSSITHLWHNTLPIFILLITLMYFYKDNAYRVLLFGVVGTGILTWLIARPSYHIGASGVIYFLCSYLFFKGIRAKHYRLIALSLCVIFIYGNLVWGTLPGAVEQNVSWEGHLSGLLAGIFASFIFKAPKLKKPIYHWQTPSYNEEEDDFMKHFDEQGNFIENLPDQKNDEDIEVNYNFKEEN